MYFGNKNTIIKCHTKIHKYIKVFLYLNVWWPWFDDYVQHANILHSYITTCTGYEYITIVFIIKTQKKVIHMCL
jgi:hypothetical protein